MCHVFPLAVDNDINLYRNSNNSTILYLNFYLATRAMCCFSTMQQFRDLFLHANNADTVEASRHFKHFTRLSIIIRDGTRLQLDPIFSPSCLGGNSILSSLMTLVICARVILEKNKNWFWIRVTSSISFASVESSDSALCVTYTEKYDAWNFFSVLLIYILNKEREHTYFKIFDLS